MRHPAAASNSSVSNLNYMFSDVFVHCTYSLVEMCLYPVKVDSDVRINVHCTC